jgi:hypothetical protein
LIYSNHSVSAGAEGESAEIRQDPALVIDHSIALGHVLSDHPPIRGPDNLGLDNVDLLPLPLLDKLEDLKVTV